MRAPRVSSLRYVLVLVPFVAFGCNDGSAPAEPNPVISPAGAATPTPPPPPPPAAAVGCNAGPGTFNDNCQRLSPAFLADVNAAIDRVVARRPDLFNLDDARGQGGFYVRNPDAYHQEVLTELRQAGFCAVEDHGEIGVKVDNTLNDQFHIMVSDQHIRRGEASYRSTCRPAWF
jgi:hypothetical protein